MAARGAAILKRLGRVGLALSIVVFVAMSVATSINFKALPGMPGSSGVPDVPKVDQTMLDKATASAGGQKLKTQGYTARSVIDDKAMIKWLDDLEGRTVSHPGPYVLFSIGASLADKPDPNTPPDVLVDATNGVISGLYQAYTDQRGAVCYNAVDIRTLASQWVNLNVYLWHKSLDQSYEVRHDDLSQMPVSLGVVRCYTFVP